MATRPLLLSLASLALLACIQDDGSRWSPIDTDGITPEEESELGAAFDAQVQQQISIIDDPVVLGVLNDLGQAIVTQVEPQPFIYRFRVVADPSLNAFAVPGGFIYIHSGTLLSAASVDELAGVVAHEIAHVKLRHYARLEEKTAIPNLLANLAGLGAMVATGQPGFVMAAQGINVAVQLRFTREFEDEADRFGANFMARAGHRPEGMSRFFERIVAEDGGRPDHIPPYLFSHPDVAERIVIVEDLAASLRVAEVAPAVSEEELRSAQARLAWLLDHGRIRWPGVSQPTARERTDPLVERAEGLFRDGRPAEARELLEGAEAIDPGDPRIPFRIGEIFEAQGRDEAAIAAYRRALALDPHRALLFYRLGLAYKRAGDRVRATYYLEQASRRFTHEGALQARAQHEIEKLTFPVVVEAGLADGDASRHADTPAGFTRDRFSSHDPRVAWWARLGTRWVRERDRIRVRWTDPHGHVVQERQAERRRKPYVAAILELDPAAAQGVWRVEALLGDDVVDRRSFRLIR